VARENYIDLKVLTSFLPPKEIR